jgi:hypothetical protein
MMQNKMPGMIPDYTYTKISESFSAASILLLIQDG